MAKKKEVDTEYFLQLGVKENGKIVKNEEYPTDMLYALIDAEMLTWDIVFKAPWYLRLFAPGKMEEKLKKVFEDFKFEVTQNIYLKLLGLIMNDEKGSKKKKK